MNEGQPKPSQETSPDMSYIEMAEGTVSAKPETTESLSEQSTFPVQHAEEYEGQATELVDSIHSLVQEHPELKSGEGSTLLSTNLEAVSKTGASLFAYGFLDATSDTNHFKEQNYIGESVGEAKKVFEGVTASGEATTGTLHKENAVSEIQKAFRSQIHYLEAVKAAVNTTVAQLEVKKRLAENV